MYAYLPFSFSNHSMPCIRIIQVSTFTGRNDPRYSEHNRLPLAHSSMKLSGGKSHYINLPVPPSFFFFSSFLKYWDLYPLTHPSRKIFFRSRLTYIYILLHSQPVAPCYSLLCSFIECFASSYSLMLVQLADKRLKLIEDFRGLFHDEGTDDRMLDA